MNWMRYSWLVYKEAARAKKTTRLGRLAKVSVDELQSIGMMGLHKAYQTWEWKKAGIITWARRKIRSEIRDYLRRHVHWLDRAGVQDIGYVERRADDEVDDLPVVPHTGFSQVDARDQVNYIIGRLRLEGMKRPAEIFELMATANLTQREVSRRLGLHEATVSQQVAAARKRVLSWGAAA